MYIEDKTTGQTYGYIETAAGYQRAAEKIHEIERQGHQVGGDVTKVLDFTHQSRYDIGFTHWG